MEIVYRSESNLLEPGGDVVYALQKNRLVFEECTTIRTVGGCVLIIVGVNSPWVGTQNENKFLGQMEQEGHILKLENIAHSYFNQHYQLELSF